MMTDIPLPEVSITVRVRFLFSFLLVSSFSLLACSLDFVPSLIT